MAKFVCSSWYQNYIAGAKQSPTMLASSWAQILMKIIFKRLAAEQIKLASSNSNSNLNVSIEHDKTKFGLSKSWHNLIKHPSHWASVEAKCLHSDQAGL